MAELRFKKLEIWKISKDLAVRVYHLTKKFPVNEQYGITSQLQRAAVSIPSNIAEGSGRGTKKDFIHFLNQSRGSLYEVITQLELSKSLGYGDNELTESLELEYQILAKRLNSFISTLKKNHETDQTD